MASLEKHTRNFVFLVRKKFVDQPSEFDVFTKILRDLATQNYEDFPLLISKLKNIFSDDQDLLLRLNYYLPKPYKIPIQIIHQDSEKIPMKKLLEKHHKGLNSASDFLSKIAERCSEIKDFSMLTKFMKVMVSYKRKKINVKQVDLMFQKVFRDHPDLFVESTSFLADFKKTTDSPGGKVVRIFTSYEEKMFEKEDCLYEMDLAIERLKLTTMKLETNPKEFITCYSPLDYKCIETLYDGANHEYEGAGKRIMENLCHYPVETSKVLVPRMKQKMEQLMKQKKPRMEKIWEKIFEEVRQQRGVRYSEFLKNEKHRYEVGNR